MTSVLFGVRRLPSGEFALVHYDQEIGDAGDVHTRMFVSLLSRDRTRVCLDRERSLSPDAQPRTAFRGDTLFVLQQTVADQSAVTFVKSYHLSDDGCAWRPVAPARG